MTFGNLVWGGVKEMTCTLLGTLKNALISVVLLHDIKLRYEDLRQEDSWKLGTENTRENYCGCHFTTLVPCEFGGKIENKFYIFEKSENTKS